MGYFDDYNTLFVSNGDTSDETDINQFATSVYNSFNAVEVDIDALEVGQNQAIKWARDPVGTLVTEVIGGITVEDYSAKAYATESKRYASNAVGTSVIGADGVDDTEYSAKAYAAEARGYSLAAEDTTVTGADGSDTGEYSAFHYSEKAEDSATAAAASASAASSSASDAAASAAIAVGQNTLSAGNDITINQTGVGPYDFEINSTAVSSVTAGNTTIVVGGTADDPTIAHGDTSSQSSVNNSGSTVIQDVTLDTYGHVTGLASKALSASDVSAVPTSGGTMTGDLTFTSGGNIEFTSTASGIFGYMVDDFYGPCVRKNASNELIFGDLSWGVARLVSTTSVDIQSAVVDIVTGAETYRFDAAGLRPTGGAVTLGIFSDRWDCFFSDITYNGSLSSDSDERLKDVENFEASWVYDLEPIAFRWKEDSSNLHYGFGAQTTYSKLPNKDSKVSFYDEDSDSWFVSKEELIAPMVKCIQEQKKKIDNLESRIEALEKLLV